MRKAVVFDLLFSQAIGNTRFHGGGEYIKAVFQALAKDYDGSYDLIACYDTERFLDAWILTLIQEKSIQTVHVKNAEDVVRIVRENAQQAEVRFFAGIVYPYAKYEFANNVISIGVCHGLRILEKPYDRYAAFYIQNRVGIKEFFKYTLFRKRTNRVNRDVYARILKRFDIIITDSEHSAYSLKLNYPELMRNKHVKVYYAPEKYIKSIAGKQKENEEQYILMISANRWLKNSYRGVMALDALYQKGLLQGTKTKIYGNLPERIRMKIKCKDCFEFMGYVNTEELEQAYQNCKVFFYPTLNEGFGLPPMEAMKYGKTCVVSSVCSLPEVYGDSVYYCNPYDIMEMQNRIMQAVDNPIVEPMIFDQIEKIKNRQRMDTDCLCRLIHG